VWPRKLEQEHQVCQFHVRRWGGRTLYHLRETVPKEWLWVLDEVQTWIAGLPPAGSRRLFERWNQVPPQCPSGQGPFVHLDQLCHLLIRLSENWNSCRAFDWVPDVPWTNNATEQVIGRMKMRSRTVRGYKTRSGILNGLLVAASAAC
jgi:hypothetical protein